MSAGMLTADTISKPGEACRGEVVVSGSHGGLYAGNCAAKGGVRAVILMDDLFPGRVGSVAFPRTRPDEDLVQAVELLSIAGEARSDPGGLGLDLPVGCGRTRDRRPLRLRPEPGLHDLGPLHRGMAPGRARRLASFSCPNQDCALADIMRIAA